MSKCSVEGCSNQLRARGFCSNHWRRWRKYGSPHILKRQADIDISGERYGRLVAKLDTGKRDQGNKVWLCLCDCGNETEVKSGNLRSGNTKSCGCLKAETIKEASVTHGHARAGSHTPEYTTWVSMRNRCKYPSTAAYPWYGGRGISVCDRWQGKNGYLNFLDDMGKRPGKGWSIDRINPDGDYTPSNCRWLPMSDNASRAHKAAH